MELKVRAVGGAEEKSVAQVEEKLLEEHQEKVAEVTTEKEEPVETQAVEEDKAPSSELNDEQVLSYIGKRYGKEINSFDDLMQEREASEELPEDVASYFKYKKETGRGLNDYVQLQKDYDETEPDSLLKDYYRATEDGLDEEDIDILMEDFYIDEDLDDDTTKKKIKLKKKKAIAKAKSYFKDMQEKYKHPLESRGPAASNVPDEEYAAYKQYIAEATTREEQVERKRSWYDEKTNQVYSPEFKGFEFNMGENTVVYSPSSVADLKKRAENPGGWADKFVDESGLLKNAVDFHKVIAVAQDPDKFARFFYEQGKAEATEDVTKKIKNINMTTRNTPEVTRKGGTQFKSINTDGGRGLKIRSIKKK